MIVRCFEIFGHKMGSKKEIPNSTRSIIIFLYKKGISQRDIAKETRVSRGAVQSAIRIFKQTGKFETRKRCGRPRVTTKREDHLITRTSKQNRRLTVPQITAVFNDTRSSLISKTTVLDRLQNAGLTGRVAMRKPLLRPQNKVKRLAWAKKHQNWSISQWKKVLWSDESKFEVFGSHRRVFVRRRVGERALEDCIVPTVKHGGGSVMVWGCFGNNRVGDFIKIEGILKKEGYKTILEENVLPSGRRLIGRGFVFQEDNDPKHSSKLCRGFLEEKEKRRVLNYMVWPPQSPDLNPIELLWDELDRKVRTKCPTSQKNLWEILQKAWTEITPQVLDKLICRMPRLCEMVIRKNGGFFDEKDV